MIVELSKQEITLLGICLLFARSYLIRESQAIVITSTVIKATPSQEFSNLLEKLQLIAEAANVTPET